MTSIKILPPALQNQIAAGEVVERPSSVVKELMENSLDAGAKNIQVYLESGGQSLIKVVDDGQGMAARDLPLALTRHATSKIASIDELNRISSFGFRGEALPSIASISQLTISSCLRGSNEGFFLKSVYGNITEKGPVAMPSGTAIKVENLLANVPARLKFLKSKPTEHKKCVDAFIRHCLAGLNTDFELFSESRSLYRFFSGHTLKQRIEAIWPSQVCENLKEFSHELNEMSASGLASGPETAQARADRLIFFVNNRPVTDRLLVSAVRQAYRGRLLSREYPQTVIFITLPPDEVDVNVHPAKTEVRFRNEKSVFSLVTRAVSSCLDADIYFSPARETSAQVTPPAYSENQDIYREQEHEQENLFQRLKEKHSTFSAEYQACQDHDHGAQVPHPKAGLPSVKGLRFLGQVEQSYLLFQKPDSTLLIVDQHAAHERIMLESIKKSFSRPVVKRLVLPEKINIHPSELEIVQKLWKNLKALGFILAISSEKTLEISAVPDFMTPGEAIAALKDILREKDRDLDRIFIKMACRSSIKSGTALTADEAAGLMQKLLECENNQYCPHGRPVSKLLNSSELEKMFKRK